MNDEQKRQYVSDLYPGENWKRSVRRMPDAQVTAIYLRNVATGDKPEDKAKLDIPLPGDGPHANEDEFEIY